MPRGRQLAALVAALAFAAAPPPALAQSAGDDQYQDPFAEQDGGGSQQQGSGSGGDGEAQPQAPSAAPSQTSAPDETTSAPAQAAQTGTLPRTGVATPLLLAYGFVLLLTGTALRRAARRIV